MVVVVVVVVVMVIGYGGFRWWRWKLLVVMDGGEVIVAYEVE